jgi:hypothetical protein
LSMLSGHKRYAHIAALRCDRVLPERICSRPHSGAQLEFARIGVAEKV